MDRDELKLHTERMREKARVQYSRRVPFTSVGPDEHRKVLDNAIINVISTELATFTYAQIIDGLPVGDVAYDQRFNGLGRVHPIDECHDELCPGVMDRALEFRNSWNPAVLRFNPETVEAYKQSGVGSKEFHLRLIELVAVSIHQIATMLRNLNKPLHKGDVDSIIFWTPPDSPYLPTRRTLFFHSKYMYETVYPDGVADIVGYWAEDRIMGGVAVFDRKVESLAQLENVHLHSNRFGVTDRVAQLRDDQQDALIKFLLAKTTTPPTLPTERCPLPMTLDRTNRVRVDWPTAIILAKVYRDEWERKPISYDDLLFHMRRPQNELDYPEIRDQILQANAQLGIPVPQRLADILAEDEAEEGVGEHKSATKKMKTSTK